MPEEFHPPAPISAAQRERTVQRLGAHFAQDHIDVEELERRLDLVFAATDPAVLEAQTADLPALRADQEVAAAIPEVALDPMARAGEREFVVAIMGGTERKGHWTPPRRLTVLALMGGACLDFRECDFGAPVTIVTIVALMGSAEIVVPPGVRVESSGVAIMGAFEGGGAGAGRPDAPLIKLNGLVMMGAVEVKVRFPGESGREARRRLKAERQARKRLRSPPPLD